MSNTTVNADALKAKIDHMQKVLDGRYKPEDTQAEVEKGEKTIREAVDTVLKNKVLLLNHFRLTDTTLPEFKPKIENDELHKKLQIVLPAIPQGASGTAISDFIGDYRIDSMRIEQFRKETYLLKRTGDGTNTLYWLATPEETKAMQEQAAKEVEAAEEAERVAKQVATKAKAKSKKNK